MKWINFLHFYQPANIDSFYIKEATEKSYLWIIDVLEKNPHLHFTCNISGCLLNRWEEMGYGDLIGRIKKLVEKNQIELTGTLAYHPIAPLIPASEVRYQIDVQLKIMRRFFGANFKPVGFFLPEMAYGPEVAKITKSSGYRWLILDEISYNGKLDYVDHSQVYGVGDSGLRVVFRSRKFSTSYVPEALNNRYEQEPKNEDLYITATDAELYGLRHDDPEKEFEKIAANKKIITQTISQFIGNAPQGPAVNLVPSNWEASPQEIKQKKYYALWYNRNNRVQRRMWRLAQLVLALDQKYKKDKNYTWFRWHLVRGLASCSFWWASAKDFRHNFGPYAWNPDEVERGVNELLRAVRSLQNPDSQNDKIKIEGVVLKIKKMLWQRHWQHFWKKL